jgi:hypothetical protein
MAASESILQLKISLVGVSNPPVWRRVLVPATTRLDRLHDVIQAAMGWTDTHLHAVEAGGVDYGPPDPELDHVDERRTAIGDVLSEPRDRMRYVYDFGDYWQHDVVVEGARRRARRALPHLRDRQGASPARGLRRCVGLRRPPRDPC